MSVNIDRSIATVTVLGGAALLAVLDGTVVSLAIGTLSRSLGSPVSTIVWVTIAYLLAAAAMLPVLGYAMARFGGRAVFLTGLALFVAGSGLAALSWSAGALIAFRAVQGLGGGLLEPVSLALAASLAPTERVGRVLGTMSLIINVAPVLGPVVGGALLGTGHWQWIFLVNLPLGAVVLSAALAVLPGGRPDQDGRTPTADVRGLGLLTVGYVAVLFAISRSSEGAAAWTVAAAAGIGVVLLAGYVRHAVRSSEPALDLRLLRRPGFAASLAVMGIVGFAMYSLLTGLPILAADRFGLSGVTQGVLVVGLGAGLVVSMSAGGRISDRTGPRRLVTLGGLTAAAALATFTVVHRHAPIGVLIAVLVLVGLSVGLTAAPTFASVFRTLPAAEQPQGTTALFMTVQLSASFGVTVLALLRDRAGADWTTVLFAALAGGALAAAALSRRLPGPPRTPATSGSPALHPPATQS